MGSYFYMHSICVLTGICSPKNWFIQLLKTERFKFEQHVQRYRILNRNGNEIRERMYKNRARTERIQFRCLCLIEFLGSVREIEFCRNRNLSSHRRSRWWLIPTITVPTPDPTSPPAAATVSMIANQNRLRWLEFFSKCLGVASRSLMLTHPL